MLEQSLIYVALIWSNYLVESPLHFRIFSYLIPMAVIFDRKQYECDSF